MSVVRHDPFYNLAVKCRKLKDENAELKRKLTAAEAENVTLRNQLLQAKVEVAAHEIVNQQAASGGSGDDG
jgi:cell division septum initiation protein DivIVA